ncbi:hypothetical protein ACIREE_01205 [Streptomyces sp. NPDC102467]|uniref:hypothetical protein n=1 Tax=Streptomyces sp. NPDC102467 TaxID=3366179 RepID=UPI0037FE551D
MNFRRTTTTRRALAAAAITTGLVLSAVGCGGDGGGGSGKPTGPSASASPDKGDGGQRPESADPSDKILAESKDGDVTVSITSATRDEGGFVSVAGSVRNDGSSSWMGANWQSDENELAVNGGSLSGASLVDQQGKKKYLVLRDTTGRCLCTKFSRLRPGASENWYAQFPAPPEGTTKLSFQVGAMPPAPIEITEGD